MNWAYCKECEVIVPKTFREMERQGLRPQLRSDGSTRLPISRFAINGVCESCRHGFAKEPAIVPPTWNKTGIFRKAATHIWRRAAADLAQADDILVFGYSVPETDNFFHYLYALGTMSETRLRRFWVFNPDPKVEPRYKRLLGPTASSRFRFIRDVDGSFENAIAYISQSHVLADLTGN
jgi:hypothetical protein